MEDCRIARCLIYSAFLLIFTFASGCQAFYDYRPLTVLAQDAETKKPIPGAQVLISYPVVDSSASHPYMSRELAGTDGIARGRATPCGDVGALMEVSASGYMFEEKDLSADSIRAIKSAGWFEDISRRPVNFVVELYANPEFEIELVLPTGYRGEVKVSVQTRDDIPCPIGKRCFSYVVPPTGVLQVTGPSVLKRVFSPDFSARYADGTPLSRQPKNDEIGFWCLKTEGEFEYFLVGTRMEFDAMRASGSHETTTSQPHSGGKGGGRGRHNRGGDQTSSSSGMSS